MKNSRIPLSHCDTILFDLDDTLIGSERIYHEIYHELGLDLATLGQARAAVKQQLGPGHVAARNRLLYFKKYLELRQEFSATLLLTLSDRYELLLADKIEQELRSTKHRDLLKDLAQTHQLGIITNENLRTQMIKLRQIDPHNDTFAFIVTSEEVGFEKPQEPIVTRALAMAAKGPEAILMVGDSISNDLEPFAQRGCAVLGTTQFRNESTGPNQFAWIDSLEALLES